MSSGRGTGAEAGMLAAAWAELCSGWGGSKISHIENVTITGSCENKNLD